MRGVDVVVITLSLLILSTASNANSVTTQEKTESSVDTSQDANWSQWNLQEDEIARLNALYEIENAFTDAKSLTPYEILGKHARDASEREHYAREYVKANHGNQRRALEWAVTLATVVKEKPYADDLLKSPAISRYLSEKGYKGFISKPKTAETAEHSVFSHSQENRLHLFISEQCDDCDQSTLSVISQLRNNDVSGVDVIFVGMEEANSEIASKWANKYSIVASDIKNKRVTLNYESEAWKKERGGRSIPLVISVATGEVVE